MTITIVYSARPAAGRAVLVLQDPDGSVGSSCPGVDSLEHNPRVSRNGAVLRGVQRTHIHTGKLR